MFAFLARQLRNFGTRRRIAYARGRQAWRWFTSQLRAVRRWIIIDLVITFIAIALTVLFTSNKPARYALVICLLIEMGLISLRMVLPILGIELGAALGDRVVRRVDSWWDTLRGNIPWWASWIVGKPGEPEHTPPQHTGLGHQHPNAVWHDVSVGGHIFHIIGTIALWKNVLLLAASLFPIWEGEWLSLIAMLTTYIILFVWTEDFVNLKIWRGRLGYFVMIVGILVFGSLALRTLAPGTYKSLKARFNNNQTMSETTADGLTAKTAVRAERLKRLQDESQALEIRYNAHLDHSIDNRYDADWTPEHSAHWSQLESRIEKESTPRKDEEESSYNILAYLHPLYLAGGFLLLGLVGFVIAPLLERSGS